MSANFRVALLSPSFLWGGSHKTHACALPCPFLWFPNEYPNCNYSFSTVVLSTRKLFIFAWKKKKGVRVTPKANRLLDHFMLLVNVFLVKDRSADAVNIFRTLFFIF